MTKTLISFIGKGSKLNNQNYSNNNSTDFSNKTGYRKTRYTLNGQESDEVTFICKALYDFLKPEKILIIGTTGSSWSEVLSNFLSREKLSDQSDLYHRLKMREDSNTDDSKENVSRDVNEISRFISKELNIEFICRIYDENSENELFTTIIENICRGDTITLDVTHGFRFTPMCALMAIQYLAYIKNVEIEKIYYGWLENNKAVKPVKDLSWMLSLNKWITAFSQYNRTNDISIFSQLIGNQETENTIKDASFYEKLTYASNSIDKLKKLDIDRIFNSEDPVLRSFKEPFSQKLAYINEKNTSRVIFKLSQQYLKARDYIHAVIYLHETFMVRYSEIGTLKHDLRNINDIPDELYDEITNQLATICSILKEKQKDSSGKNKDRQADDAKKIIQTINDLANKTNKEKRKKYFDIYDKIAKYYMLYIFDKNYLFLELNSLRNGIVHGNPNEKIKSKFYKNDATMYQILKELSKKVNDSLFREQI